MPFQIGESVNYLADRALASDSVKFIAKSPFVTAAVIGIIVTLTILIIFRDADVGDDSIRVKSVRGGLWAAGASLVLLFLHFKVGPNPQKITEVVPRSGGATVEVAPIMTAPPAGILAYAEH